MQKAKFKTQNGKNIFLAALILVMIVSGGSQITTQAQEVESPEVVRIIETDPISIVEWNPQSNLLAVAYRDSIPITILNARTGEIQATLSRSWRNPLTIPRDIKWSPNGEYLASLHGNYSVQIWDTDSSQSIQEIAIDEVTERQVYELMPSGIAWNPDGSQLAVSNDYSLSIWNMTSNQLTDKAFDIGIISAVVWSHDSTKIAIANRLSDILVVDPLTFEVISTLSHQTIPITVYDVSLPENSSQYLAWNADDTVIATFFNRSRIDNKYAIFLRDATTGTTLATLEGHQSEIQAIAWSPDGSKLASASSDQTIHIWDMETLQLLYVLEGHTDIVTSVAWNPDGTQLVSGSWDGTIRIWKVLE